MIKFTNVSRDEIQGEKTNTVEFTSLPEAYSHFGMFVSGRKPFGLEQKIISVSRTTVVVEDKSPVTHSRMTYEGPEEEMVIPVALAAGTLCTEMQSKAKALMDNLMASRPALAAVA